MTQTVRVLIVEDDDSIRDLVDLVLSSAGYEILTATDGAAALQVVGTIHPDLVLLDMRMPVMDGWEFARWYRAGPEPHAPIVVVTAARVRCRSGAKPTSPRAVLMVATAGPAATSTSRPTATWRRSWRIATIPTGEPSRASTGRATSATARAAPTWS